MWGVSRRFGASQSASPADKGSGVQTSIAAPARWPDSSAEMSAGWSTRSPRPALPKYAPGFIAAKKPASAIENTSYSVEKTSIPITSDPERPRGNEFRDYEIDDLIKVKKQLEKDYDDHYLYPILRNKYVREIRQVLQMLDWHYDRSGEREFRAQRARTKAELADFDRKYQAALRGS